MTETIARPTATPTPTWAPAWTDEFAGPLTCVEIADITHDVRSFSFELPGATRLQFAPGQYLTFTFDIDGTAIERCYTISSSPFEPSRPTITVKRVPGGPVSNWLHDQLRVGDTVGASGPYGVFSTTMHPAEKYLFVSAGSGITPLMSMTRALRDAGPGADVVFVHCARTPDDIIFRDELAAIERDELAAVTIVCEDDSAAETWDGPRGRLSLPVLLTAAPDLIDRDVFTCGPPPFMAAVREHLDLVSAEEARCHQESFLLSAADPPPAVETPADTPVDTYRVLFRASGREINCDRATPLLTAAAQAGITLPSSCGEGVCGTCKTSLLSGSVDMRHGGGIRKREIDAGKVLLCCSTPLEDLELDG
ncbi:MAG: FAD-binding oxidoreductase [Propionibacteriaceae bacterium]